MFGLGGTRHRLLRLGRLPLNIELLGKTYLDRQISCTRHHQHCRRQATPLISLRAALGRGDRLAVTAGHAEPVVVAQHDLFI